MSDRTTEEGGGPGPSDPTAAADLADSASVRRAAGTAIGFGVVALTWNANGFSASGRQWAAALTILLGAVLVDVLPALRRALPWPGAAPATLVAALVAAALCVPETDQFPVAALLPGSLLVAELVGRRQLGVEWYGVAALSVGWAAVFGASGRQSALVGAMFAWWPVFLPVIAVALLVEQRRRDTPPIEPLDPDEPAHRAAAVAAVVGSIAAIAMARTGGIADSGDVAVASVLLVAVGSAAVVGPVVRRAATPHRRQR